MQHYMLFLVALYEANMNAYLSLGLTELECRGIISDTMIKSNISWMIEVDEGTVEEEETQFISGTPTSILTRLISWGWLKKDFDEKLNQHILSFPEYSQLYIELFQHLQTEDDSRERENILSIYSALYTFYGDKEKNNDILRAALITCRKLSQLLTNMQDGMRSYFEKLSQQKDFIGIQAVLVSEINNSDSKKYAILTTTDSFYRYKEEIKELMSKILEDNLEKKDKVELEKLQLEQRSEARLLSVVRLQRKLEQYEETEQMIYRLEREFDLMEQKYKKLIEQKSVFAKRALARMHYILQEGSNREDYLMQWIQLLNHSEHPEELLGKARDKMYFTSQYRLMSDQSFSNRKAQSDTEFTPVVVEKKLESEEVHLEEYVPKPLYTKKELRSFKEDNMENGKFVASLDTVQSIEDLEKLLFLWQEATESLEDSRQVELGQELRNEQGMRFSQLTIAEE